jgi:hypothetical protein
MTTCEERLLTTAHSFSAMKTVTVTATGGIINCVKARSKSIDAKKASPLQARPGFPDARQEADIHPQPTDYAHHTQGNLPYQQVFRK